MADKKLYRVSVAYDYYVYAADELEAEHMASDTTDFIEESAKASLVRHSDEPISQGWNRNSEVFFDDNRTYFVADEPALTLGALLDQLPRRGEA